MKKFPLLAIVICGLLAIPGISGAQLRGEAYFSLPMPTGDFADTAEPGFGLGGGIYFPVPQLWNMQIGGQVAYNWFNLDPVDGGFSIIELAPTARLFLRDYDDTFNVFNLFLQVGVGAYRWNSDPDVGDGDDSFDFGFSVGVGASGRFTDRWSFFLMPKFTWIQTDNDNITYVPLNLGVLF